MENKVERKGVAAPKVSVIVPVYKAEKYLRKCVDSILAQTFRDFEVLLVDDGSPDGSGAICDEYAEKDPRVRVFHKENGGQSSARNLALGHIHGEYICFCDSDDMMAAEALSELMKIIALEAVEIVAYRFDFIDEQSRPIKGFKNDYIPNVVMSGGEFMCRFTVVGAMCMYFYSAELFRRANLRLIEGIYREDEDFVMRAIGSAKGIVYVSKSLYFYRWNSQSTMHLPTMSRKKELLFSTVRVIESLSNFKENHAGEEDVVHGVQKKLESLAVSVYKEFFQLRRHLQPIECKDIFQRMCNIGLFPLRIQENGVKYKVFSVFLNLVLRCYGI